MLDFVANWISDFQMEVQDDPGIIDVDDWKLYQCMAQLNTMLCKQEHEAKR